MWFQFAQNESSLSIDRMVFRAEYSTKDGDFFRAPDHFKTKLTSEGGCKALVQPPLGAPDNLPEMAIPEQPRDYGGEVLALRGELSQEKSTSSALRAELGATLHERDQLKLQVHELTEKILELETKIQDEGLDEE